MPGNPSDNDKKEEIVAILRERDQVVGGQAFCPPEDLERAAIVAYEASTLGGHPDHAAAVHQHLQHAVDRQAVLDAVRRDGVVDDPRHT